LRHTHDALSNGIRLTLQRIIHRTYFEARLNACTAQGAAQLLLVFQGMGHRHGVARAGGSGSFDFSVGFHLSHLL